MILNKIISLIIVINCSFCFASTSEQEALSANAPPARPLGTEDPGGSNPLSAVVTTDARIDPLAPAMLGTLAPAMGPEIDDITMDVELAKYASAHLMLGKGGLFGREIRRLFPYCAAWGATLLLFAVNYRNTSLTKGESIVLSCDNITQYVAGNKGKYDFSGMLNISSWNNITNETDTLCIFQSLVSSHTMMPYYTFLFVAGTCILFTELLLGRPWMFHQGRFWGKLVSSWQSRTWAFQQIGFVDMVSSGCQKRTEGIKQNELAQFLVFAHGKYDSFYNASGPFNQAGFEAEIVAWKRK